MVTHPNYCRILIFYNFPPFQFLKQKVRSRSGCCRPFGIMKESRAPGGDRSELKILRFEIGTECHFSGKSGRENPTRWGNEGELLRKPETGRIKNGSWTKDRRVRGGGKPESRTDRQPVSFANWKKPRGKMLTIKRGKTRKDRMNLIR